MEISLVDCQRNSSWNGYEPRSSSCGEYLGLKVPEICSDFFLPDMQEKIGFSSKGINSKRVLGAPGLGLAKSALGGSGLGTELDALGGPDARNGRASYFYTNQPLNDLPCWSEAGGPTIYGPLSLQEDGLDLRVPWKGKSWKRTHLKQTAETSSFLMMSRHRRFLSGRWKRPSSSFPRRNKESKSKGGCPRGSCKIGNARSTDSSPASKETLFAAVEEASQTVELNKLLGVSFGEDEEGIKHKLILL